MADYCVFCDTRRPEGGTRTLVLNEGRDWLEFCERCGDSEWLVNSLTDERITIGNLVREVRGEPTVTPLISYDEWLARDYRAERAPSQASPDPAHPTLADIWPA